MTLTVPSEQLSLGAKTAADLMTWNPISVRDAATVHEAIALLTSKGFTAAPVIDDAGRPVGVISQTDILVHDRNKVKHVPRYPEYYQRSELKLDSGELSTQGSQVEAFDATLVRDIMTPAVFSVTPDATARRVVDDFVALKVHRLFVVDQSGVLVGVVSALDVLRRLT